VDRAQKSSQNAILSCRISLRLASDFHRRYAALNSFAGDVTGGNILGAGSSRVGLFPCRSHLAFKFILGSSAYYGCGKIRSLLTDWPSRWSHSLCWCAVLSGITLACKYSRPFTPPSSLPRWSVAFGRVSWRLHCPLWQRGTLLFLSFCSTKRASDYRISAVRFYQRR
jgi:hypothetical protein